MSRKLTKKQQEKRAHLLSILNASLSQKPIESKLLPHFDAVNLMNTKIGTLKIRLSGCIALTTLKLNEHKQEKSACYDYLSGIISFSGTSGNETKELITGFDGLCRLYVDSAIFTNPEISIDSPYDLVIFLWRKTCDIISLEHFIAWWTSSKNEKGLRRGELLLTRYREQVKNLTKVWLKMLFKPDFGITSNACYHIGIWERQFFWNKRRNEFCLLDIMLSDRRMNSHRKTSIFGMHNIEDEETNFSGIDQSNTPLLKFTKDYCDCLNGVFKSLELWYLQTFKQKKIINLAMFGLGSKPDDDDSNHTVSSVQSILCAVSEIKSEINRTLSENELASDRYYKSFSREFSKLENFFLEHETKVLLGAFKAENGHYLRQLFPRGGVLPKEIQGDLKKFFSVGFRAPFVGKFFRMAYILYFSQDELCLEELMKNRDTYFSNHSRASDFVLGVNVPPLDVFVAYASKTLEAIKQNEVAFDVLLTLIEAFDSALEAPHQPSTTESEEPTLFLLQQQTVLCELEDDVVILTNNEDCMSEITNQTGLTSRTGTTHSHLYSNYQNFNDHLMKMSLYTRSLYQSISSF